MILFNGNNSNNMYMYVTRGRANVAGGTGWGRYRVVGGLALCTGIMHNNIWCVRVFTLFAKTVISFFSSLSSFPLHNETFSSRRAALRTLSFRVLRVCRCCTSCSFWKSAEVKRPGAGPVAFINYIVRCPRRICSRLFIYLFIVVVVVVSLSTSLSPKSHSNAILTMRVQCVIRPHAGRAAISCRDAFLVVYHYYCTGVPRIIINKSGMGNIIQLVQGQFLDL